MAEPENNGDGKPAVVPMGRDVDVGIPIAAATGGEAIASNLRLVLAEMTAYAAAGGLVLDWATLAVGIEQLPKPGDMLPPLVIRARIKARRPRIKP